MVPCGLCDCLAAWVALTGTGRFSHFSQAVSKRTSVNSAFQVTGQLVASCEQLSSRDFAIQLSSFCSGAHSGAEQWCKQGLPSAYPFLLLSTSLAPFPDHPQKRHRFFSSSPLPSSSAPLPISVVAGLGPEGRMEEVLNSICCKVLPSDLCCGRVPCWLFSMRFWINMKSHLLTVISAKIFQLSSGGTLLPETPASRNTPAALGQTSLCGPAVTWE